MRYNVLEHGEHAQPYLDGGEHGLQVHVHPCEGKPNLFHFGAGHGDVVEQPVGEDDVDAGDDTGDVLDERQLFAGELLLFALIGVEDGEELFVHRLHEVFLDVVVGIANDGERGVDRNDGLDEDAILRRGGDGNGLTKSAWGVCQRYR